LIPGFVLAINDVTLPDLVYWEIKTSDSLPVTTLVTTNSGGKFTQSYVGNDYIDITLDNTSDVTFNTTVSGQYLQIVKQSGSNNYSLSPSCITTTATMKGTGAAVVLRLRVVTTAPSCASATTTPIPGAGGAGGGVGQTCNPVANPLITINNGAASTNNQTVSLSLSAPNASDMLISEDPGFTGQSYQPYVTAKSFTLSSGYGTKKIYAKFRNNCSMVIATATIVYGEEECLPITCGKLTYDLYLINPDGSERHVGSRYVRTAVQSDGSTSIYYEDSGSDFDYNDLVLNVNKIDCNRIIVKNVSINAGWHHHVRMKLFYNGALQNDFLIWPDSHLSVEAEVVFNANDKMCLPAPTTPKIIEPPAGTCTLASPINQTLNQNNVNASVNAVQNLLQCLGYFPETTATTFFFGPITLDSVKKFQQNHGLPVTGVVDAATLAELNKYLKAEAVYPVVVLPGDLIKLLCEADNLVNDSCTTVYYVGENFTRYVFPNVKTYMSLYDDYSKVKIVTLAQLMTYKLAGNMTYKPGALVKLMTNPAVYVVTAPNILRKITSEAQARQLYGDNWASLVEDIPDAFWVNYVVGQDMTIPVN